MKRITTLNTALKTIKGMNDQLGSTECILINNPSYIYQPSDLYILAPRIEEPIPELHAIVKDMDGTTTTTEPLCLHSLEYMLRRISNRMTKSEWEGFDHKVDYPHIIGNSTTKHVEYLINKYHSNIRRVDFLKAYIHSALWTLVVGKDPRRRDEVRKNTQALGLGGLLEESDVLAIFATDGFDDNRALSVADKLAPRYDSRFRLEDFHDEVRAAVDVYYQRYHYILSRIEKGEGSFLAREVGLPEGKHLVEPMPGVGVFLAAVRGWLGAELELFYDEFVEYVTNHPLTNYKPSDFEEKKATLRKLGLYLEKHPVKVAVVTSSILYEANIVLNEVFSIICDQIKKWPVCERKKSFLLEQFASYKTFYDAVITASDSSEIRLKPHRDLYSMALFQLGITPDEFKYCIGFEDSESGVISIRAAGLGLCIGVPFADSAGHNLEAATFILHGGIPETILQYNLFLKI